MPVETGVNFELKAEDNTKKAFRSLNDSLRNTSRTLQVLQGPLGPIAGRFTALASLFGSVSIGSFGLAAGVTSLGAAFIKSTISFAEAEKQLAQLEAQLKSTGGTSGKTAGQLEDLAQSVASSTLASVQEVRKAEGILLSFRSVGIDTFDRALKAAQDLSATGFGDLTSTSKQLGKALENPIKGVSQLAEAGVTFTEVQKVMIEGLVETGQLFKAQSEILKVVESQVGGAGEAGGSGLAGAFDRATQSLNNFWVALGQSAERGPFKEFIEFAARKLQDITNAITPLENQTAGQLQKSFEAAREKRNLLLSRGLVADSPNVRAVDEEIIGIYKLITADQIRVQQAKALADSKREKLALEAKESALLDENQAAISKAASVRERDQAFLLRSKAREDEFSRAQIEFELERAAINRLYINDQGKLNTELEAQEQRYVKIITKLSEGAKVQRNIDVQRKRDQEDFQKEIDDSLAAEQDAARALESQERRERLAGAADTLSDSFRGFFDDLIAGTESFEDAMMGTLSRIASRLLDILVVTPFVDEVAGAVGSSGVFAKLFRADAGIDMKRDGRVMVGEKGPEILTLPSGSKVTPLDKFTDSDAFTRLFRADTGIDMKRDGRVMVGEKGPEILTLPSGSKVEPVGKTDSGTTVNVQVINNVPDTTKVSTQQETTPDGSVLIRLLLSEVAKNISTNGVVGRSIDASRGTRIRGVTR